ncbi:hypothetical protein [Desulfosarcina cetonica]|uniref:hypothetical protein n=1 Tax=Desulfosarcina cetonica TaxID=90730 RepID=UPI0006D0AE41|nr:hypothetical protein [Desulfosarcina cetonica]
MKKIIWIFVVVLAVAGAGPVTSQAQVVDPELQQLLDTLAPEETVKVLVQFSERIDLKTFQRKAGDR